MSEAKNVSDEQINALIDNQLAADERARLLKLAENDSALAQRIAARRHLKEMISSAYLKREPRQERAVVAGTRMKWPSMAAAMALFTIGVVSGITGHLTYVSLEDKTNIEQIAMLKAAPDKMILQIDSHDPKRMQSALRDAEEILRKSRDKNERVQLEVIANATGLKMLDRQSPYRDKIARLSSENSNVKFLACGAGMQKMRNKGQPVNLMSDAIVVTSVRDQVARRLNEGWSYLRE